MGYIPDLTPWEGEGNGAPDLLAVGWLDRGVPFPKGDVSAPFFAKLVQLLVEPWQPWVSAGMHPCSLCRFTGGPGAICHRGTSVTVGSANLYVPNERVLYVAPSMVAHYVDAHDYQPPGPFVDAVLACAPMRSIDYLRQLKVAGGIGLENRRAT